MDFSQFLPPAVAPYGSAIMFVAFVWSFFWKGLGLWFGAKNDQKIWFVAILLLNTLGILEIVYLFYFAKKRLTIVEVKKILRLQKAK